MARKSTDEQTTLQGSSTYALTTDLLHALWRAGPNFNYYHTSHREPVSGTCTTFLRKKKCKGNVTKENNSCGSKIPPTKIPREARRGARAARFIISSRVKRACITQASQGQRDFLLAINLSSLVGVRLEVIQSSDVKAHYGFPGNRLPSTIKLWF